MKIPPYSLEILPSRFLFGYIILVHGLLLLTLFYLPLITTILALLLLVVVWHSVYSLKRYCQSGSYYWVSRCDYVDRVWCLQFSDCQRVVELRSATVWRYLIAMNFACAETGRVYHVVLLPDSGDRHQLRRLRVLLRHLPVFGVVD